jgi:hypothetical protein
MHGKSTFVRLGDLLKKRTMKAFEKAKVDVKSLLHRGRS